MSQQPGPQVQVQCGSCGKPYLLPAEFQNTPHQCPICGVQVGGQMPAPTPMAPQMGMQPGGQPPQPGMQQPGMQQPNYQQPSAAPTPPAKKSNTLFIIRTIVGCIAVIVIIVVAIRIIDTRTDMFTVRKVVDLGYVMSKMDSLNPGPYSTVRSKTFQIKFEMARKDEIEPKYTIKEGAAKGARISSDGTFRWKPGSAADEETEFVLGFEDPNDGTELGTVKFKIKVID